MLLGIVIWEICLGPFLRGIGVGRWGKGGNGVGGMVLLTVSMTLFPSVLTVVDGEESLCLPTCGLGLWTLQLYG